MNHFIIGLGGTGGKIIRALRKDPARRAERYLIAAEIREARNAEVARVVGGAEVQLVLVFLGVALLGERCGRPALRVVHHRAHVGCDRARP